MVMHTESANKVYDRDTQEGRAARGQERGHTESPDNIFGRSAKESNTKFLEAMRRLKE
jgi:hypothetical protein